MRNGMNNGRTLSRAGVMLLSLMAVVSLLLPTMAVGMDGGKININIATPEQLTSLPGIGLAKADAIVAYREGQGPFTSIDALSQVRGIGSKLVEKLRDLVTTE
jgi:competence protein ComEA